MRRSRLIGGILAAALQLAIAILVWTGFSPQLVRNGMQHALTSLDLRPAPAPPPPPAPKHTAHARSGRAAPAHIRVHAAAIVAPPVPILKPPPVPAAITPGTGIQTAAGAAPIPGPGSGAGGSGQGTGSGNSGDGEGDGDGGRDVELTGGRIKDSDIPEALRGAPFSGTTRTAVAVNALGRVAACRILHSSGNSQLDDLTCRLIFQRFRFRAALDARGQARSDAIVYEQEWTIAGHFNDDSRARQ